MGAGVSAFVRLARFPGLLLAIVGACAVVGAVTFAGVSFLDVAASQTLSQQMTADGAFRLPTTEIAADTPVVADVVAYRTSLLAQGLEPAFGAPIVTARGDVVTVASGAESVEVRLVSRTDALEHVTVVAQGDGDGSWLADVTAATLGVGPGDEVTFVADGAEVTSTVAGIYGDLMEEPRTPYWASLDTFIWPAPAAETRPPAPVLLSLGSYLEIDQALLDDQDPLTWEFLLPSAPLSMQEAERARQELDAFRATLLDESRETGSAFTRTGFTEPLSGWIERTEEVVAQIGPPVQALMAGALVLSFSVLGGAGAFMVRRRRVEFGLLDARGVGLTRIGLRTAAEALLPVLVGLGVGAVAGWAIVGRVVPGGVASDRVASSAARALAVVAVVSVVLVATIVARSVASLSATEPGGVRRAASRAPWEAVTIALAVLAYVGLRGGEEGGPIDPLFLLFPVLVLAGAVGLAGRGLRRVLPRLRGVGARWPTGAYLAARRLTAASRGALSLLMVAAVAVGVLVYAATVAGSVSAAADEAASLAVGSDVSVEYAGSFDPGSAGVPVTAVARIERASFAGDDREFEVLLVDPATFAEVAAWQEGYADRSIEDLMGALAAPPDPRTPVIVAGDVTAGQDPVLTIPGLDVPVEVVGTASAFPGMVGERPLVVMDRAAMQTVVGARDLPLTAFVGSWEVWGSGGEAEVVAAVTAGGATVLSSVSAADLRDTPEYVGVTSMLQLLLALGVLAGSVVFVVIALYLAARQRSAEVAYALSRRMGLARATSGWSLRLEVLGLLGIAFVLGAVVALGASALVAPQTQARVVEAETTMFRVPGGPLAVAATALLAFAVLATALVQRRADRANVAEVMRGAR